MIEAELLAKSYLIAVVAPSSPPSSSLTFPGRQRTQVATVIEMTLRSSAHEIP